MSSTLVAVYARAPVPGEAKTRLIPTLGPCGAAVLHARLVKRMLGEAISANIGPVELWCAPDETHPFFVHFATHFEISLRTQARGELGERMACTIADGLGRADSVLLVGSDIPDLSAAHLVRAREALAASDAVFIPAEDGGYVLVGMARPHAALFKGIGWGGPQVMQATRERAASAGLRLAELEALWDLDRPEDISRLAPALLDGLLKIA